MVKIKAVCNWSSTEEVTKRLLTQFKTNETDTEGFEFVYDDTYDFMVIFGYLNEPLKEGVKAILFPQEPTWSGGHQKSFDNDNIIPFGFEKSKYPQQDNIIETIAHMFYGGRGLWEEGFDFWYYDNLMSNEFNKTKTICSFVSNRGSEDSEHPDGCTYGERVDLIKNIHKDTPYIDFYGWGNEGNLKPFVHKKGETIKDYKFSLTIENSHEKYYISEKFYDCMLTNTIPIYYGCSNIKDYWHENGYILLDNITDHQYITDKLNWINENQEELYKQMLPELLKMKKRYFEEFNLLKKVREEYNKISK